MQDSFSQRIEQLQADKAKVDEKYEKKRKDFKELEATTTRDRNQIERDYAVETEKLKNQIYKSEQEAKAAVTDLERFRTENEELKNSLAGDKSVLQTHLEAQKQKYDDLDNQYSELLNKYEREKELSENKIAFIEQQKETAKREVEES